jgi:hypothetical protein
MKINLVIFNIWVVEIMIKVQNIDMKIILIFIETEKFLDNVKNNISMTNFSL